MKFKKKTNKQKYLRKDKKKRSVKKQGICGLFAIARAIDIDIKTQKDADEFRNTCIEKKCVDRKKNWIGGTTEEERMKICLFHGYEMRAIFNDVIARARKNQKSVGVDKLLKQSEIFKTNLKMILTVNDHCLYLETNKTKKKLYLMDQGRKKMKLSDENKSCWFKHILRQRVKSLYVVEKINRTGGGGGCKS
jgi:hypothetical protein